jgi:hypothetical protein
MKIHSTNYTDAFIQIADDCPAIKGEIPPAKNESRSVALMQFELVINNPYKYTSDEVLFQVFADRQDLTEAEYAASRTAFFSKGQACFRASPLTKRYGWGVHFNHEGKMAIFGVETGEYQRFLQDKSLKVVKAMKSAR